MKQFTGILLAVMLLCGINNAFAKTEDRHLSGFNAISLSGSYDVYITQGNTESVKVEAPDDEIERIVTEVQNGVLKIYTKKGSWNWSWSNKKVAVYVNIKTVNSLGISGSGNVYFKEGINADALKVRVSGSGDVYGKLSVKTLEAIVSGSGDIKVSGHADNATVSVSGSGDYTARDLATVGTTIRVSGSGDATVNASQKLEAAVSGSGDIRYTGGASQVTTSAHGSGEIHRM
ncbi:DUF2807 domain-containing protein [Mucilaginibacter sp. HMF5004]|uniref:head GIN domain-containing protein n=1 Tax=Mucilaginibacter rivuli TaxID=2857527 RepID=UPI001C5E8C9B|nr:head GIN domain-containing protein [Mucilaginibacter rivuli]MBW4888389.1 DUF2807 domain-containing protein [Mucilaginibacter rivuli]